MKISISSFILLLCALLSLILPIMGIYNLTLGDKYYKGEILFEDESSYLEFKKELASDDVKVEEIASLDSPNHFVYFDVKVKRNHEFNYGDSYTNDGDIAFIAVGLGLSVFFSVLTIPMMKRMGTVEKL